MFQWSGSIPLEGEVYLESDVGEKRWLLGYMTLPSREGLSFTSEGPQIGQALCRDVDNLVLESTHFIHKFNHFIKPHLVFTLPKKNYEYLKALQALGNHAKST